MSYRFPEYCDRCDAKLRSSIMSKFNQDIICLDCRTDEKLAPGYKKASEAELQAVRSGVWNYSGVGLSAEDRAFLKQRRAER